MIASARWLLVAASLALAGNAAAQRVTAQRVTAQPQVSAPQVNAAPQLAAPADLRPVDMAKLREQLARVATQVKDAELQKDDQRRQQLLQLQRQLQQQEADENRRRRSQLQLFGGAPKPASSAPDTIAVNSSSTGTRGGFQPNTPPVAGQGDPSGKPGAAIHANAIGGASSSGEPLPGTLPSAPDKKKHAAASQSGEAKAKATSAGGKKKKAKKARSKKKAKEKTAD